MARFFSRVAPDRLQIREGGGALAVFGLPFLAVGIFLGLPATGLVTISDTSSVAGTAWPTRLLLGLIFTVVGSTLVFGRAWTIVDGTRRLVTKQWGLVWPIYAVRDDVGDCKAVTIGFEAGDSDSAEQFPILIRSSQGPDRRLCSFTQYPTARACATAAAELLAVELEDATTDHPRRMPAAEAGWSFQQRTRSEPQRRESAAPPAVLKTGISEDGASVRLAVPMRPLHPIVASLMLLPAIVPLVVVVPLGRFFRQTHTPDPLGWVFIGLLVAGFGILPAASALRAWIGSRVGRMIVTVSREAVVIQEHGLWRITPRARIEASDVLDVDYSTRASRLDAARRAAQQRVIDAARSTDGQQTIGPGTERLIALLSGFASGRGVIIKTRQGLTTFGEGLADDEIEYLHDVVRRALVR